MGLNLGQFSLNRNLTNEALDNVLEHLSKNEHFFINLQLDNKQLPSLLKLDFYEQYKERIVAQLALYLSLIHI